MISNGWLSDYDAGSVRSISSGRFKPSGAMLDELSPEPFEPLDLHDPASWRNEQVPREPLVFGGGQYCSDVLPLVFDSWDALYAPVHKVERYAPTTTPHRAISRRLRLKDGRRESWRIAPATPSSVRDGKAVTYQPRPEADLNFWSPEQMRYRRLDVSHDYVEPPDEQAPSRVVVRRISWRRLCIPVRWIPMPFEPTGSDWFPRFSKIAWVFKAVNETSAAVPIGPGTYRVFLVAS